MVMDFALQMGVTKIPNLTADGRDGFSSKAQHDWCVERYLGGMCEKKRGKALIDKSMYERVLGVLFDENDKQTETAQFRWWVRRTFRKVEDERGTYLIHENRPLAVKEQIYDILVYCHAECGHGGRDKTSAVARRYYSWIPKDVVSRFVSVCPGCHARTQKDDRYFSNKGSDGYYPVHEKVRELSIARGHASTANYEQTAPYQPSLAAGMIKLLKGPVTKKGDEAPSAMDLEADEFSPASQHLNIQPTLAEFTPAAGGSFGSVPSSMAMTNLVWNSASQYPNTPQSFPVDLYGNPTASVATETSHASGLRVQSPIQHLNLTPHESHLQLACISDLTLQSNVSEHPATQELADQRVLVENPSAAKHSKYSLQVAKLAKSLKVSRNPKPAGKTQARKTSSKTKINKKVVVSEVAPNLSMSSSVSSNAFPRSQDSSATSTSEDDNTSKSDLSSPTQFYPLLPPQFDYSFQSFDGCVDLNREQSREFLSHPTLNYDGINVVAIDRVSTPLSYVSAVESSIQKDINQSNHSWNGSIGGSDLMKESYGNAFESGHHDFINFHPTPIEVPMDALNPTSGHDISLHQNTQSSGQLSGIEMEFSFPSSQTSASESQLGQTLAPLHSAPPLVWSLSAPNEGTVRDGYSGLFQGSPQSNLLADDGVSFPTLLNVTREDDVNNPYASSDFGIDYSCQVSQLVEQAKHRPPMLQLPPQHLSLEQGPRSAPLLGGHFDYSSQRTGPNFFGYPHSAGLNGQFPDAQFSNLDQNSYDIQSSGLAHHLSKGLGY
ncbi:hypothetical protein CROQUDRAFT_669683 [Cronartium quercuum f. sp. fusiforme G11]|uniref:Integrase zinc-binding domain-containing protein n=1 Tax=Cronartium quercuum f. sp. fusiforme G11 TaxID=708437 RepID=A0A9P6TDV1_9BASI|nr:hypothetical protein CROQUDRAFT_669683 [Cronartium quercuum f. sp. fusiforme G11]